MAHRQHQGISEQGAKGGLADGQHGQAIGHQDQPEQAQHQGKAQARALGRLFQGGDHPQVDQQQAAPEQHGHPKQGCRAQQGAEGGQEGPAAVAVPPVQLGGRRIEGRRGRPHGDHRQAQPDPEQAEYHQISQPVQKAGDRCVIGKQPAHKATSHLVIRGLPPSFVRSSPPRHSGGPLSRSRSPSHRRRACSQSGSRRCRPQ